MSRSIRKKTRFFGFSFMLFRFIIVLILTSLNIYAQKKDFVIGFGSCLDQNLPTNFLNNILLQKPDIFIFMGDNIYHDSFDPLEKVPEYKKFNSIPQIQTLKQTSKILATWDDHDYGVNDVGAEYEKKDLSQKIFLDAFDEPKDSFRYKRKGIYDSYVFQVHSKNVQILILDTRYFRTSLKRKSFLGLEYNGYVPNFDPNATILGDEQWRWLDSELDKPADLRILVSSIQFHNDKHRFEKWGNFPKEKQKLIELLKFKSIRGLIILSGDRHIGEFYLIQEKGLPPTYEITSSPLNKELGFFPLEPFHPDRIGNFIHESNFGILRFAPKGNDLEISMELHSKRGLVLNIKKLLSELQKVIE